MTWDELIREYLPDLPEEEAGYVLWNLTCFPFGDEAEVRADLAECREMGVEAYRRHVSAEMERAMAECCAREAEEAIT